MICLTIIIQSPQQKECDKMKTIWKYELELKDKTEITMPKNAEVVACESRMGSIFIWSIVDPEAPLEKRVFRLLESGFPIKSNLIYIGTNFDDLHVWHLFEEIKGDVKENE